MAISYLNGSWQPIEEARVSVLDRGFMFGDGIYEVIPVYAGKVFTLHRHLLRLANSLAEIQLKNPLSMAAWTTLTEEAVTRSGETTAYVYIQVTRGLASKRDHAYPNVEPTVLVMVYHSPILERQEVRPYKMITLEDFRWSRGHIKSVSLMAAGMLKNAALSQGADDAILIRDGLVMEATASNIFIVKDAVIKTPPKSMHLLHGITRDVVVELALANGLALQECAITAAELAAADEVMITSSGHEVWPVASVDGKPVGNGAPGVMWKTLDGLFQGYKKSAG
ncbi:MAG: aminotransferase class IV [Pseudomonadales bacterium]|jgi:D-alanine transaminase|nr:aminotransferase class IV [Pseudomonadales bacterium]MDP5058546.1 aminotransferase class IV [Pseudomonadales bacterium]